MKEHERNCGNKPSCCQKCVYYQPRWKHRFCYFIHCPYRLVDSTFRKTPLKKEHFPQKEVVDMKDV